MSRGAISSALDAAVIPGFSRVGFEIRSRLQHWDDVEEMRLQGRVIVVTGPTSGLGLATVQALAKTGAQLVLVARNRDKCELVVQQLHEVNPSCLVDVVVAEMGDLDSVAAASRIIREKFPRIDVLVHNAGALLQERAVSQQGLEQTVASHVLGPFLMTSMLRDALRAANGRVVTVSSGGMYTASLPEINGDSCPEVSPYNGSKQYALAKRLQVTLNELWAKEEPAVQFVAMHPGWADTPGVQDSIPLFRTLTKPILRTPQQGADTIAWLSAVQPIPGTSGSFWCDREIRSLHKTSATRKSDTLLARQALWNWCTEKVKPYV
jgi:NAD(P)-dependent dehydrogenase (short-subunit alcohol dehydrogenase family)